MSYKHDPMMRDESMARSLHYQAECIWPHEKFYLNKLQMSGHQRVLDVGCGTGIITARLAQEIRFNEVVGVDIIEDRIHQAQRSFDIENLSFVHTHGGPLPFDDHSFDLVVNRHVLQVIPDPHSMIRDMTRVCRPGGTLYFLAEDYGMLHMADPDSASFWLQSAGAVRAHQTDLWIGRRLPEILMELGLNRFEVHYISIDTINSDRNDLVEMFTAWRDGYAAFLSEVNQVSIERACEHFNRHIAAALDPKRYLVWHIPLVLVHL